MKRALAFILTLALTFTLVGLTPAFAAEGDAEVEYDADGWPVVNDSDPEITIIASHPVAESTPVHQYLLDMAARLSEKSNGKITMQIYPNNQLGSESEVLTSVTLNEVQMAIGSPQVTVIPEVAVFDMPMVVSSLDQATAACAEGEFRDIMEDTFHQYNLELGALYSTYFRVMTSNVEIQNIEDFQGVDIRTMENKYHMNFWSELGCNPTPIAYADVYVSLQQGLIDAQENTLVAIDGAKLYEQQDYTIITNHIPYLTTLCWSKDFYDGLPANYRALLDMAVDEFVEISLAAAEEENQGYLDNFEANGVTILEPSEDLRADMTAAAESTWDMVRTDLGDDLVDAYLNAAGVEQ